VNADGSLARPPIALCEVQAYLFRAWRQTAHLLRALGDLTRADELERLANDLRERFNRDFWSERLGCYVLALQRGGAPAEVVASNTGQVLWGGIAHPDKAERVVERLMQSDMFSGWGIRTLSSREVAYNPISYHLGSVWPHDNALIIAGLRRYGHDEQALRVYGALFDAATNMPDYRMPELYCGYERREGEQHPVRYPVACSPQAWAASSMPFALWNLLGLRADAVGGHLRLVRPCLPPWVDQLELRNLPVGQARVDLRFERTGPGRHAAVAYRVRQGQLHIEHVHEPVSPDVYT
jgi:glycogen debranching enzyme